MFFFFFIYLRYVMVICQRGVTLRTYSQYATPRYVCSACQLSTALCFSLCDGFHAACNGIRYRDSLCNIVYYFFFFTIYLSFTIVLNSTLSNSSFYPNIPPPPQRKTIFMRQSCAIALICSRHRYHTRRRLTSL